MNNSRHKFDFLVIGGGIAGLTYALEVAGKGSVGVLFKRSPTDSSTAWAQGGIAAVTSEDDDFGQHAQDTHIAGAGLSKPSVVDLVVTEGPDRVRRLIELGASFDRLDDGAHYDLHREGGHSQRRIFHSGDATGWEIQRTLIQACRKIPNISFLENYTAIDLITSRKLRLEGSDANTVLGAYALNPNGEVEAFSARKLLVATGGAGKIYLYTSNPDVATGDGIAMCFRAGASVANMEFFQFHPTCLFHPAAKSFLITEAMRGEGGILRRADGEAFMKKYDSREELAPRDIVARAIDNEMKMHGEECVYLDMTHKSEPFLKEHFPTIYERCLGYGFDIARVPIPVVPAAHYCCGGVASDDFGRTDIRNLYVAGECAHSGLHGANRLASNSLLEGLVFGRRAALDSLRDFDNATDLSDQIPDWEQGSASRSDQQVVITHSWDELRRVMWNYVGIVRTDKRLEMALRRSTLIAREIHDYYWNFVVTRDLVELRNITLVSQLVIHSAVLRKESRGLHYTTDWPQADPSFVRDTVIRPEEWFHFTQAFS